MDSCGRTDSEVKRRSGTEGDGSDWCVLSHKDRKLARERREGSETRDRHNDRQCKIKLSEIGREEKEQGIENARKKDRETR